VDQETNKLRSGIRFSLAFVAILWAIKAIELAVSIDFSVLGIYPRTMLGSVGIFAGPLIHGDVTHLISNSIPLLVLLTGLFYFYRPIALKVFFLLYLMTGIWVWFAAREAYHIGASGLVYGIIAFLLFSGFIRRDIRSLSMSFIIMILYGGNMFYGIIPGDAEISWESHLLGMIAGVFCAIYFRRVNIPGIHQKNQDLIDPPFETSNYFKGIGINTYQYSGKHKQKKRTYYYTLSNRKDH